MKSRFRNLGLALVVLLVGSRAAQAEYEGVAFGVEEYGGAGQCGGSGLNACRNDAAAVRDALAALGYEQTQSWYDGSVDAQDFTDGSFGTYGWDETDPTGTDWADVVFFAGHGTRTCGNGTYRSYISLGDANSEPDPCNHALNWLFLSDAGGDANVMLLASCQSAQKCVWENSGYDTLTFGSTQFNMLNGFHGLMWDSDENTWRYGHYVELAELNGIGDDWVDWLTDASIFYPEDQCAVSAVWGETSAKCSDQYNNGGYLDFHITHPLNVRKYYYLSPCDPDDGEAL